MSTSNQYVIPSASQIRALSCIGFDVRTTVALLSGQQRWAMVGTTPRQKIGRWSNMMSFAQQMPSRGLLMQGLNRASEEFFLGVSTAIARRRLELLP